MLIVIHTDWMCMMQWAGKYWFHSYGLASFIVVGTHTLEHSVRPLR